MMISSDSVTCSLQQNEFFSLTHTFIHSTIAKPQHHGIIQNHRKQELLCSMNTCFSAIAKSIAGKHKKRANISKHTACSAAAVVSGWMVSVLQTHRGQWEQVQRHGGKGGGKGGGPGWESTSNSTRGDFSVGREVGWPWGAEFRVDWTQCGRINNWCFILQETEKELCSLSNGHNLVC